MWDAFRKVVLAQQGDERSVDSLDGGQVQMSLSGEQAPAEEAYPWRGAVAAGTDLKAYWYPMALSSDINSKRPHGVRLLGEPLVLYRDNEQTVRALHDRCPHKNAQLSAGRVEKGQLECFYHGWKFDGSTGAITDIPANPRDCPLPSHRVKTFPVVELHGIVWLWPGDPAAADPDKIPRHPVQDNESFYRQEICVDLPCDHSYFVENLMDMAHTPFAHDGIFNVRSDARPLRPKWSMTATGMAGMVDNFFTEGLPHDLEFVWTAPVTNEVRLKRHNSNWRLHMFFYAVPTAPGQCRHIFIMHRNWGWFINWIPRPLRLWLDLGVIHGDTIGMLSQQRNMREGAPHITLATACDEMAVKYRKWLSKAMRGSGKDGGESPWWRGWNGKLDIEDLAKSCAETSHCYADGSYERAAVATGSSTDSRHLVTMWKVQNRWKAPLGFERQSSSCSLGGVLLGFAAGVAVVLAAQRKR